ncbi:hypothetical protein M378DRAFT_167568 [Amanita muscaria Koide BX008]|uniref:Uncharacterized protein n=1 Tax=Amanita muscaria (strain Koide BX008) TaxID=946122 RepID=A0A0C2WVS0_AMAMK|nr:hypothetical protein M378DRAFT_167568 [Amanita muscaria Koide BX008]
MHVISKLATIHRASNFKLVHHVHCAQGNAAAAVLPPPPRVQLPTAIPNQVQVEGTLILGALSTLVTFKKSSSAKLIGT